MTKFAALAGSVAVMAVLAAILAPPAATHPRLTQVTWTADIAPIIERRCLGCHVEGGFGPMPLTSYDEVRAWGTAIGEQVMERRMPPWPAARGIGDFNNDRSLTALEFELLLAWTEGGTPLGPPVARRPPAADAVAPGRPDLELPLLPPATASPVARYELATGLAAEKWITSWTFRPLQPSLVERVDLRIKDDGFVASWVPPESIVRWPAGVGRRLAAGATLLVDVHYRKSSAPRTGAGSVALYFGARPRHELAHRAVTCGESVLDEDLDVLAVQPRASEAGASFEAVAQRPDLSIEPLVVVRRFLPGYVPTYRFRSAVRLPRGSRIHVRSSAPECGLELDYVPVR